MGLLQKLGMLCAALAVASCAAVQPRFPEKFQEVQIPPERISQKGFSLVPLNETGWVITGRSASQLALGKLGKTPEENVVIRADLASGNSTATAWGCDMSPDYVHINSDYTT